MEELTRGEEKNDMWQAIHLSCQHVISTTFKPHVNRSYSPSGEGDLGRNQLTHPDTAGECMEIPQWEQRMWEIGKNERHVRAKGQIGKREKGKKWGYFLKDLKNLLFSAKKEISPVRKK